MSASNLPMIIPQKRAWNRGRIIGQKRPLLPKHVWAIRVRLELAGAVRDLALFNLAVNSKLRGCDLVTLRVSGMSSQVERSKNGFQSCRAKPKHPFDLKLQKGPANLSSNGSCTRQ